MDTWQEEKERQPVYEGFSAPWTEAVYLYCIARTQGLPCFSGPGVEESHPIFLHSLGELTAVASYVPAHLFAGPESEKNLQNPAWVGPRAYRHEALIEYVMRHVPVLPLPLGTLFTSLERMEERLKRHKEELVNFLRNISGKAEWSLKGYVEPEWAQEAIVSRNLAAEEDHLRSLSPGKRYFREKRIREQAKKELSAWTNNILDQVVERLRPFGSDFCERGILSWKATGRHMVSNWAYLIADAMVEGFHKEVDHMNAELDKAGMRFELSGPWPPYSFSPALGDAGP